MLTHDLVHVHSFLHFAFAINHTPVANTCSHILSEEGLIGRICQLCACIGPIHIQSEGSRLLATLVKYCRSPGNADDSTTCLVLHVLSECTLYIPYSRKIWRFGGSTSQPPIKIHQY
jgi:hypothetical protein